MSQYATKHLYQVLNPNEDTFILKGWDHNPETTGRTWYFVYDEERYNDKLLHCTVDTQTAKSFVASRETKFYDPITKQTLEGYGKMNDRIDIVHHSYMLV